jgi:POT family proton-dependent oligopeptide transporter
MITRLSPTRLVSTMMGGWFLATGFSSYLAAVIAAFTESGEEGEMIPVPIDTVNDFGNVYGHIAIASIISSVICFLLVPILNKWMHEDSPHE